MVPLTPAQIRDALPISLQNDPECAPLLDRTPAWLYFLCEAQAVNRGERLGPVASAIVAETIVGLLRNNPRSVLHAKNEDGRPWSPQTSRIKLPDGGAIKEVKDILRYAGVLA